MVPEHTHALVVGAGLGGSLMALYLAEMGCRVTLVERRPDPREKGFIGGRSINLALSTRGITALKRAGLDKRVLADAIPMRGRMMHSELSDLTFQPYSANPDEAINSVSRGGLNLTLLREAGERENVTLRFGMKCLGRRPRRDHRPLPRRARGGPRDRRGHDHRRRRGVLRDPGRDAEDRPVQLLPELPRARVQGADDPAHRRRRVRDGPARPAHLAPRRVDDDRPAQPGQVVHLHALLALQGAPQLRGGRHIGRREGLFHEALRRCRPPYAHARRGLREEPDVLARHDPLRPVDQR